MCGAVQKIRFVDVEFIICKSFKSDKVNEDIVIVKYEDSFEVL
jgi:hypothetical protein